jgi:protein-disulfide isomerase
LAVGVCLAAVRSDVTEGNPRSPVRVVIYEDLQCPDCARLRTLLDEKILPRYGGKVAFIHRDFPLARHDWARAAAIAGRWVWEQDPDAAIAFRREILAEQNSLTPARFEPWLAEFARRYRLDARGISGSPRDSRLAALVDQDLASGNARAVKKIPAVFVGGQILVETILEDDLTRALDTALTDAGLK